MKHELPNLLSEADAAEYLGVATSTLRRWRSAGKISHVIIGNSVKYTDHHLLGFLETHTHLSISSNASDSVSIENPDRRASNLDRGKLVNRNSTDWSAVNAEVRAEHPANATVPQVLNRYHSLHGSKIASRESQHAAVKKWIGFFGDLPIAELSIAKQEAFVAHLRAAKYSDGYIRRVVGVGKAAIERSVKRQELISAPHIVLPPDGEPFPHYASTAQIGKFICHIPDHLPYLRTYCMIRLCTGCRGDAALGLGPEQIDFEAGLVQLNPTGRRQTKKYRPVVPLTATLRAHLETLEPTETYVHRHGRKLTCIRRVWRDTRAAAKLPLWFVPKVLRHSLATELRRRGVPGWEVSGQLGHRTGDSHRTTQIYAKFDPAYLGQARVAIDEWIAEILGTSARPGSPLQQSPPGANQPSA